MANVLGRLGTANVYDNAVRNISQRQSQLSALQVNLTSGKRVVHASDDPTADVSEGRRISEMNPGARFEVMDGCGHWPQYEDPKTFNRLHIDFLLGR